MKNIIRAKDRLFRTLGVLLACMYAFVPLLTYAAECANGEGLCNPLDSRFSSIPTFIEGALQVLVVVALPIIGLFIVIAGFMFVLARGNSSGLEKAKKNFLYVIIGAGLILGAWVIAKLLSGTVAQLLG
ncbi:hypothetical protein COU18_03455 [Candidatus Kaiserbacteria bacterium CG10_big_fil_rev_8_21_14_0_10_51_14]|uniref:Uncharacterized protein n=1 Tax=Candidatus Kaiserbacteria bacterium CG10_big_fil_rev_8_21_14_0_10_51_14 TaxID=1974610 RepID=A0A2H0UBA6_9BACT|nr:MAG: hypothetical protein COU18_03455 [Candidatus Kaiserbacteria bacterium CG10_big_fil_rev_8_21_14_0_10_51_14]